MDEQFERNLVLALVAEHQQGIATGSVADRLGMSIARSQVRIDELDEELLVEECQGGYMATDDGLRRVVDDNLDHELVKYLKAVQSAAKG